MRLSIAFAMFVLPCVVGGDAVAAEYKFTPFQNRVRKTRRAVYEGMDVVIAQAGMHQVFMRAALKGREIHVPLPKSQGKLVVTFLVDGKITQPVETFRKWTKFEHKNDAELYLTIASSGPDLKAQKDMEIDGGWHLLPSVKTIVSAIETLAREPD
jgi:hypothetical protein